MGKRAVTAYFGHELSRDSGGLVVVSLRHSYQIALDRSRWKIANLLPGGSEQLTCLKVGEELMGKSSKRADLLGSRLGSAGRHVRLLILVQDQFRAFKMVDCREPLSQAQ